MIWMEKQLEALTELVKELTRERTLNEQQMSMKTDSQTCYAKGKDMFVIWIVSSKNWLSSMDDDDDDDDVISYLAMCSFEDENQDNGRKLQYASSHIDT